MFVFPAFTNGYKTRKRTFRCCKKCRQKRIRCIILDQNYELHGCDNCKKLDVTCDLISPSANASQLSSDLLSMAETPLKPASVRRGSTKLKLSVTSMSSPASVHVTVKHEPSDSSSLMVPEPSILKFDSPVLPLPMGSAVPSAPSSIDSGLSPQGLYGTAESGIKHHLQPSSPGIFQNTPPGATHFNLSRVCTLSTLPTTSSLRSIPEPPQSMKLEGSTLPKIALPPYANPDIQRHGQLLRLNERSRTAPTSHPSSTFNRDAQPGRKPEKLNEYLNRPNAYSVSSNSTDASNQAHSDSGRLSIDSRDQEIEHIDYRYLKRRYDFKITYRQSNYFFDKLVSRRQAKKLQFSPTTDHISKKLTKFSRHLTASDNSHYRYLLAIHAFTLDTPHFYHISPVDLVKLYEIYFFKVNSIFPVVFEDEFWELYKRNKIPSIISYAVVLNAARDEMAEPILARSFVPNGKSFEANLSTFLKELDMKIRQLLIFLPELGDTEKLARLVTTLLLSLSFKFNKFGNEQSSNDVGNCVSYAYSLLIHHDFFHVRVVEAGGEKKSIYLRRLWWVLFIFDRFNALLNGKAMYIKRLDFNISRPTDLPHLDRLVSLAYALDDTLIAVFRPRQKGESQQTLALDTKAGDPVYDPSQLITDELETLNDVGRIRSMFSDYERAPPGTPDHLPNISLSSYRDRCVHFFERLINHQIILILRTGQIKYVDDALNADNFSLELGQRLFDIYMLLKDGQGHKLFVTHPLIPLVLLVAFAVPLITKLKLAKARDRSYTIDEETRRQVMKMEHLYLAEMRQFSSKLWFVHEVITSLENVEASLDSKRKRKESLSGALGENTDRLAITSLVSDVNDAESILPSLVSITSPGFYDDAISDEEDELKRSDEDVKGEEERNDEFNHKALVPPLMFSQMMEPTYHTCEDLAVRAMEKNMSYGNLQNAISEQVDSSKESVASFEGVNFDIAHFAEMVNTETSFIPNVMDFFNEQSYDFMM